MIGDNLRKLRIDNKMTLDELKEYLETTKCMLSLYENNKKNSSAYLIKKYSIFFKVSSQYVVGISNSKKIFLNNSNIKFGERLKFIRLLNNLTLDDLARNLDTSKTNLSRYENCKRTPKIDFVIKCSSYFNVSFGLYAGIV